MSDFERINAPRVEKVVAMLETINKSARSNRVSDTEIARLLAPIDEKIEEVWPAASDEVEQFEEDADVAAQYKAAHPEPKGLLDHGEARHLARTIPLAEAVSVMQIIATRIEEELFAQGEA